MDHLEYIVKTVDRVEQKADEVNDKIDGIITRNSEADKAIAVIKANQENHERSDNQMFEEIRDKHNEYDKFIRGIFIFAIVQLIAVIVAIAT